MNKFFLITILVTLVLQVMMPTIVAMEEGKIEDPDKAPRILIAAMTGTSKGSRQIRRFAGNDKGPKDSKEL